MAKPAFDVNLSDDAPSSLEAHGILENVRENKCWHLKRGLRLPLGIYNVSVSRTCDKLRRLGAALESYFGRPRSLSALGQHERLRDECIDYMELSLYAAAEHVDDLMAIAQGFYAEPHKAKKDAAFKKFGAAVKENKRYLSAVANHLKHQQGRIRLFSMEASINSQDCCLHGYFVETVDSGTVRPHPIFHSKQEIFSLTAFTWEVVLFLLQASRDLASFLRERDVIGGASSQIPFPILSEAVVAAARLPLFTFQEEHAFDRATLRVHTDQSFRNALATGLQGSLVVGWGASPSASFGRSQCQYQGDGSTRSFHIATPKGVSLHHWQ